MVYRLAPAFKVRKKFVLGGTEYLPSQDVTIDELRTDAEGNPITVRVNVLVSGGYIVPIPDTHYRRGMPATAADPVPNFVPQGTYLKQSAYPPVPPEPQVEPTADPPVQPLADGPRTIIEVLEWVGDDYGRAQTALEAEQMSAKPRSTLVEKLETMLGSVVDSQEDPAE